MDWLTFVVVDPVKAMLIKVWGYIPAIAGAIVILVVGWKMGNWLNYQRKLTVKGHVQSYLSSRRLTSNHSLLTYCYIRRSAFAIRQHLTREVI